MDLKDLQNILEKMEAKSEAYHKENQREFRKINDTLIRNTTSLEVHVKRTNLLEKRIELIHSETKPIHDHVTKVEFFFKMIKWIGIPAILTGLGYLIKVLAGN